MDGMSDEDDDSMQFEQDPQYQHMGPLDKMRKVRREVIRTINEVRDKFKHPGIFTDPYTNEAAVEYA